MNHHTLRSSNPWATATLAVISMFLWSGMAHAAGSGGPNKLPPVPDLTHGGKPDASHDWTLGPTGARGWIHAWKLDTSDARQILITKVDKGSPADGTLLPGDVILGTGGTPFATDARTAFGKAVTLAESTAGKGTLPLIRWRRGTSENIDIQLPVLGDYSDTAPYDCPKSKRIFEQGCEAIATRMKASPKRGNPIERSLNALALLASGNPEYRELIAAEARWAADFKITELKGFQSWWYGFSNMFLAEYVLATGDQSVMPGMKRIALEIANGQSYAGTWGHTFANKKTGILYGYGAMNSPALSLTMSLVLAREAGVSDPAIDEAIRKSNNILSFYIGKGAIPYGDHTPWMETHEDNGKCGAAAVMFDFLGNTKGATFFSRMSTASYGAERDGGHTGNFFNLLWALPGISRSGPQATGAWMKEFAWYLDFARRWDGTYVYQGEPAAVESGHKYAGWDSTGAYLLGYALPLKSLRLTGRKPSIAPQLDAAGAASLIADGRGFNQRTKSDSYHSRSREELLKGLQSWSPIIRKRSAGALAAQKADVLQDALTMMKSGDLYAKLGACEVFQSLRARAAPAVAPLREALAADDLWLRMQAATALAAIGPEARSAIPQLLRLSVEKHPDDPRGMLQRYVASALFQQKWPGQQTGLLAGSLEGVDRQALDDAVRAVLKNEDGRTRWTIVSIFDRLTFEEIKPLLPAIYDAVAKPAPSGIMFADRIRLSGLEYLAKHHIKEALPLCVTLIEPDRWGQGKRWIPCLDSLQHYAGAAKSQLPALRQLEAGLSKNMQGAPAKANLAKIQETIRLIENTTEIPELKSLND